LSIKTLLKRLTFFSPLKAGLLVVAAAAGLYLLQFRGDLPLLDRLTRSFDNRAANIMFLARGPVPATGQVVIVDIDEKSLADPELGQMPWPRDRMAKLLRGIHAAGPRAIGIDIVFAEPDRTSLSTVLPAIEKRLGQSVKLGPDDDHDAVLGRAVADTGAVLGYLFVMEDDGLPGDGRMPASVPVELPKGMGELNTLINAYRATLNVPAVDDRGLLAGYFNMFPDESGMVRKVPLLMGYRAFADLPPGVYTSLALSVYCAGAGVGKVEMPVSEQRGFHAVKVGEREMHVDPQGQVHVNFRGPAGPLKGTFRYVSAGDVYHGRADKTLLADRYVLVGTSAGGLVDLRPTPFSVAGPGVEVHASVIDNLIASDAMRQDRFLELAVTLLLILAGGGVLAVVLAKAGPVWGGLTGSGFIALAIVGNYHAFFRNNLVVGVTWPLLAVLAVFLAVTLANYFTEGRQKRFLRGAFSRYVSAEVVDELVKDPHKLSLAGEERVMTIMFADIRNFTSISEKMQPQEVCALLNDFLTEMTDQIKFYRGTVDKFLGDEIMAFWGAPTGDNLHAINAVRAGLAMRKVVAQLAEAWKARGLPPFDMGVGLNTGKVRVGNMGSREQFSYTVIGDNVNLASRLQGLNKAYCTGFIISQSTLELLPDAFLFRPVDVVKVVGRQQPVMIYEPLAPDRSDAAQAAEAETFARAFRRYRQRRFADARAIIEELQQKRPERFYEMYLERLRHLEAEPPPADWDGVFVFKTK
jgi:adenylate cyclase